MFPKLMSTRTSECGLLSGCNKAKTGIRVESNHWCPHGSQKESQGDRETT